MKRLFSRLLLAYFRTLAQVQLRKVSPIIIGITGSAGKTSTLQACEATLADHFQLKVSHKANSQSGIPLNILDLHIHNYAAGEWLKLAVIAPLKVLFTKPSYTHYLVEMGIDGPDEPSNMSYLLKILRPDVGVFLNVAPTHAEPFDHLVTATSITDRRQQLMELIAAEKGKLITALPETGIAILNGDEPLIAQLAKKTKTRTLTFGSQASDDVRVLEFSASTSGTILTLKYLDQKCQISFSEYIFPVSYKYTFASAMAVGISQGLSLQQASESLEKNFKLPPGRSSLIEGINGSLILDSSYNASTAPMLDMLELMNAVGSKRKFALLGDMRELGEVAQHEHEVVATAASKICDEVYLVGPYMKKFALPVIEKTKTPVMWFENAHKATNHLKNVLRMDDLLLVKGSQNTLLLEIAVEQLMAHPENADALLCRRGEYWDKQRKLIEKT